MRSTLLTGVAVGLAVLAAALTFAYIGPGVDGGWVNLLAGVVLLGAPLVGRPPLTRQRLLISALIWFCLGLLGSYFFGTVVCFAGILLGAVLLTHFAVAGRSARTAQASPATFEARQQAVESE